MSRPRPPGDADAPADGDRQQAAAYWLSRPPAERLAEVERLRREHHGPDYDDLPMELVARIVQPGKPTRVVDLGVRRTRRAS